MPTIRELRMTARLSRKSVARESGISESTLERMENQIGHTLQRNIEKALTMLNARLQTNFATEDLTDIQVYDIMTHRKVRGKRCVEGTSHE